MMLNFVCLVAAGCDVASHSTPSAYGSNEVPTVQEPEVVYPIKMQPCDPRVLHVRFDKSLKREILSVVFGLP